MNLPYIINVALVLGVCLSFYKLLLHRETFYKINRYVLILCLVISFALPLPRVPQQFSLRPQPKASPVLTQKKPEIVQDAFRQNSAATTTQFQNSSVPAQPTQPNSPVFSVTRLMNWLFWTYWFGVALFGASFLFQVILLVYRSRRNPVIIDGPYRIVEVTGDKAPCSFGNTIFINPEKYEWETYNQILLHEKMHIRQRHTVDIIVAELALIFQWFNPFAWTYRREVENNLEFLTDDQLMQKQEVDKTSYQLSLVKVSVPHFPLSLTTNYNQSILKKRIAMMNSKRSSLHTAWKYFFLVPVLAFLACLLNEPAAQGQKTESTHTKNLRNHDIDTEGSWFATIKGDKISIQFRNDDDVEGDHNFSGNTYKLSELTPEPKEGTTTFKMMRDAGAVEFTGRFENNTGMGHYKFVADRTYGENMSSELKEKLDDHDLFVFFLVDVKKGFVSMLKSEGYTNISKDDLVPVAALKVDQAYIHTMKTAGLKDITLENLVTFKALGIDEKYIAEIREAGYKNISTDQLVSFKAQGIDKDYITKVRQLKGNKDPQDDDADDIVSFKAMGIDESFVNSFKAIGLTNIPNEQLVSFKAVGVTPEYIKTWRDMGFKDIDPEDFVSMKSQDVTPAYMKGFTDLGYKEVKPETLVSFKALGITPDWIHGFENMGYKNIDLDNLTGLKAQNITPEFIKSFEAVGFTNIPLDEIVAVKAVGVTPEYVKDMKAKGFNYNSLEKYVTLKSIE